MKMAPLQNTDALEDSKGTFMVILLSAFNNVASTSNFLPKTLRSKNSLY